MILKSMGTTCNTKRSQLGEGVMLITAHSSKGLEWKYVFGSITGFHKLGKKSISRRKQEELRRLPLCFDYKSKRCP